MAEGKRLSLVKPTVNTPFHVDFQWWKKNERDWHVYLRSLLCPEHQEAFANIDEGETIDWVDPVTAEVEPVDGIQNAVMSHCVKQPDFWIQNAVMSHCVKQPDFLTDQTALVEAVFRLFLTNGNFPMSSKELGERLKRAPETILRTLAGPRVYKGLRPFSN